jgi:hypothetical protein
MSKFSHRDRRDSSRSCRRSRRRRSRSSDRSRRSHWYNFFRQKKTHYFSKYTNLSFRGETSPQVCINNGTKMRLDLRVMLTKNNRFIMDSTNCEYTAKTTCSKLFKDRLKMVLGGKAFLNEIIKHVLISMKAKSQISSFHLYKLWGLRLFYQ